jgi:hypothetical protein
VRILLICGIMMASCMDVQDGWIRDHEETRTLDLLSMGIGQGVLSFDFSLPLDTAEVNWGAVPATHQEIEGQKLLLRADLAKALVPEPGPLRGLPIGSKL